jgi:hypothetical protein
MKAIADAHAKKMLDSRVTAEFRDRIQRFNRLLDYMTRLNEWEAKMDEETGDWVLESETDSKRFEPQTSEEQITVWIVQNLFDEVPY